MSEQQRRPIRTPDQRLRVFVSSAPQELGAERDAVRQAIQALHLSPVMPDIGARPYSPQALYRAYVEQSDVFVGVYGAHDGEAVAGLETSSLRHEYQLASGLPRLLYVKDVEQRDASLRGFLDTVEAQGEASYRRFTTAAELGELVRDDLAILLSERFDRGDTPMPAPAAPRSTGLPAPVTALVGRDHDVAQVRRLLADPVTRLVTLTGPGGIGKTRLALAVARAMTDHVADVSYVPLASLRDAGAVLPAVADALGVRVDRNQTPLEALVEGLAGVTRLLLLDNVEHVAACGPQLLALLEQCPELTIVATSRVLLRVRGEYEYAVGPLDVPAPETAVRTIEKASAVELFVTRAREVNPRFALDERNAADVAEICRRLDGLPLAIELAAARIRLLTPAALLARLTTRLDVLGDGAADLPERQRTLAATIEWSVNLLPPEHERRFVQLGVFVDGWDLDAAAAVWEVDDAAALDTLGALLDSSLITAVPGATDVRFRMLQTLYAYVSERFAADAHADEVRTRHARWYASRCDGANHGLQGLERAEWTRRLREESGNISAAVEWLVASGDIATVARIGWELFVFWWQQARTKAAFGWMTEALRRGQGLEPSVEARLRWVVGGLAAQLGDADLAMETLDDASRRLSSLGDTEGLGACYVLLAPILALRGHLDEAEAVAREAAELLLRHDNYLGHGIALSVLGTIKMVAGELDASRELHRQALSVGEQFAIDLVVAQSYNQLGIVAVQAGEYASARDLIGRAADGYLAADNTEGIAMSLEAYAMLALAEHDQRRAAVALAHALLLRERIAMPRWPLVQSFFEAAEAQIRQALGEAQYAAAQREGRALTRAAALQAARGDAVAVG